MVLNLKIYCPSTASTACTC